MVQYVGDNAREFKLTYGNIAPQSVGAIQRSLLALEDEGGSIFFGEPDLKLDDWIDWDEEGKGIMNILECQELAQHPLLYSTFLLWMLSEIYEMLPEAGDLEKPKLAFFFDEAHLLFNDAPKALVEKVEQVVRLIRSKGVSVWFITQVPSDLPDNVLGQIGNRVQHALRAYTPKDQKALRPLPSPSGPIPISTLRRPCRSWPWARPWSPCWMPRVLPPLFSAPVFCRPTAP